MRKNLILCVLSFLAVVSSCTRVAVPGLRVGDTLPRFEAMAIDGRTFTTDVLRGSTSVVVFFNTWCPDCHELLPVVQACYNDTNHEIAYVCIARGQKIGEVRPFWKENEFTMTAVEDPAKQIYDKFTGDESPGVPLIYILDKYGVISEILKPGDGLALFNETDIALGL